MKLMLLFIVSPPLAIGLDSTVIISFLGFLGICVTALCGVWVAAKTGRTEKENSAKTALDQSRDEAMAQRIAFRDEQIANLKETIELLKREHKEEIDELKAEQAEDTARLQAELLAKDGVINSLRGDVT